MFLGAVALLGLAAFGLWKLFGSRGPEDLGPFLQPLLCEAVSEAVSALPREKMPPAVFIPPVRGDIRDQVRQALREELERRGLATPIDRAALGERLGGESFVGKLVKELLGGDPKLPLDLKRAGEFLKRTGLPGLLLCEAGIEDTERRGSVSVRLTVLVPPQGVACRAEAVAAVPKSFTSWRYVRSLIVGTSLGWRLVGWAVFVLLLPLVTAPLLFRALKRESNLVNALSLFTLTAVSAASLWLLLGFSGSTPAALCVGVLGFAGAGVYHYLVLEFFEDLRR